MKICGYCPEETNQKLISYCLQNEIESKRAEFKTWTVINIMYIIYWPNKNFKLLIKTAIEWLTFLFLKCDERQMNCLPLMKSCGTLGIMFHAHYTSFRKIEVVFVNLNYAHIYRCLCLRLGNKVKMERIIVFTTNHESAF